MNQHDQSGHVGEPEVEVVDRETDIPQQPARTPLYEASKLVPVGDRGYATPATLEHQITFAQCMAKAKLSVPAHLHSNVGDCLAIVDMSQRAGLSPYMVAQKTYQQGGKLCFESQLFHSFLIQSRRLYGGGLAVRYEGEGPDRVCIVSGHLIGDPEPKEHRSRPFKDMHPGHVTKDGKTHVKGSPLWDDKPDVQQFYDTSRDWVRMFCPVATLGMLDPWEQTEHPLPPPDSFRDRLKNGSNGDEGHKPGHAAEELDRTAADKGGIKPAEGTPEPDKIKPSAGKKAAAKKEPKAKAKPPTAAQTKAAADRAQSRSDQQKAAKPEPAKSAAAEQQTDTPPKAVPKKPANAAEYQVYAIDWIERGDPADPDEALSRWNDEMSMRDRLAVPIAMRNDLRERMEKKHGV